MANPEGSDTLYEWIEIYNPSDHSVSLTSWTVDNVPFPPGIEISAENFLVVAKNKDALKQRYPELDSDLIIQASISLKNSDDEIILTNGQFEDKIQYETSSEEISWERINLCTNEIELSNEGNTIGFENSNFEANYCSEPSEISFLISSDGNNFTNEYSALEDASIQYILSSSSEIDSIKIYDAETKIAEGSEGILSFNTPGIKMVTIEYEVAGTVTTSIFQFNIFPRIYLNEILPNPEGSDEGKEWIELFSEHKDFSLSGWILGDKSSSQILEESTFHQFLTISPKISLNNSNEEIYLYTPNGLLSDTFQYESTKEDVSFSRNPNGYGNWTDTLPQTKNESNETESPDTPAGETFMSIADFKQLELDAKASISGITSVEIDILGSKSFYIQDESAGIRVFLSSSVYASGELSFSKGQIINLFGIHRQSRGEDYIYIEKIEDIIQASDILDISVQKLEEGIQSLVGSLVYVEGVISKKTGSTIYVSQNGHEFKISILESTGIDYSEFSKDQHIKVFGILSVWGENSSGNTNYRILPRYDTDIELVSTTKNAELDTAESKKPIDSQSHQSTLPPQENYIILDSEKIYSPEVLGQNEILIENQNQNESELYAKGSIAFSSIFIMILSALKIDKKKLPYLRDILN
jgi:hypothetical protein